MSVDAEPKKSRNTNRTAATAGAVELTSRQRRALRALGHSLKPTVMVGQHGLTDGLVGALDADLLIHELIKVKVQETSPVDASGVAQWIQHKLGAAVPQVIGRTLLVYRAHPEEPKIRLPDAGR